MNLAPNDPRHGSTNGWRQGCRCSECCAAATAAAKRRRYARYEAEMVTLRQQWEQESEATGERWLPVVGYETYYEVSDHGRVRRVARGQATRPGLILSPATDHAGYHKVVLNKKGHRRERKVHALVLEAFVGPAPSPAHVCNHRDACKTNNAPSNLEWATVLENAQHAKAMGLLPNWQGERNNNARLTEAQVLEIRARVGQTNAAIAREFGIGDSHVSQIRKHKLWAHVGSAA